MIAAVMRFGWATADGGGAVVVCGAAGAQETSNVDRATTRLPLMFTALTLSVQGCVCREVHSPSLLQSVYYGRIQPESMGWPALRGRDSIKIVGSPSIG